MFTQYLIAFLAPRKAFRQMAFFGMKSNGLGRYKSLSPTSTIVPARLAREGLVE